MGALPDKPLFRPNEVAAFCELSVYTIWRYTRNGVIEHVHIGGVIRIPRRAVVRLLEERSTVKT